MIRLALILLMFGLAAAQAQLLTGVSQSRGGGTFTPPSCNNSLDFTQACNSVYIAVIL